MNVTRRIVRFVAAALFGAAVVLPPGGASPPALAVYNPTGYGRMDCTMCGGTMDDNSPFMWAMAREQRHDKLAMQMLHIQKLQSEAETAAYRGMLDGTYSPAVRYSDAGVNVAGLLAKKIIKSGLKNMTQEQAEAFLNAREADYERAVTAEHLPVNSLTSACAYWVDSLYAVGAGVQSTPSDREQMRATCALTIGKTEKLGSLTENDQRYTIGRALAMIGGTFRTLATQPDQRTGAVNGAKAMFKSNFGYEIDAVPVAHFPCVLSDNKMSDCDIIMSRYGASLPEIARRNT